MMTGPTIVKAALFGAALWLQPATAQTPGPSPDPGLAAHLAPLGWRAVPLTKLKTGHETLRVTVNGVEGLFVLDSGASGSVIDARVADKYRLGRPVERGDGTGIGGRFAVYRVAITSLRIGEVALPVDRLNRAEIAHVVDTLARLAGVQVDGIIGQDVLTRFGGIIDVGRQQLYLRP